MFNYVIFKQTYCFAKERYSIMNKKSIFKKPFVKALTITVLLKIIAFFILYILFFSKDHRLNVNPDVLWQDLYAPNTQTNTK